MVLLCHVSFWEHKHLQSFPTSQQHLAGHFRRSPFSANEKYNSHNLSTPHWNSDLLLFWSFLYCYTDRKLKLLTQKVVEERELSEYPRNTFHVLKWYSCYASLVNGEVPPQVCKSTWCTYNQQKAPTTCRVLRGMITFTTQVVCNIDGHH